MAREQWILCTCGVGHEFAIPDDSETVTEDIVCPICDEEVVEEEECIIER